MLSAKAAQAVSPRYDMPGPDGAYRVTSLYFDTPYDSALREKLDGVNRREKFRLRYYGTDLSFIRLEKKFKVNGLCGKRSARLTREQVRAAAGWAIVRFLLDSRGPAAAGAVQQAAGAAAAPEDHRSATTGRPFFMRPGNVRITLDRDIRTGLGSADFLNPGGLLHAALADAGTVLEVKYDAFLPEIVRMAVQVPGQAGGGLLQIRPLPAV